MIAVIFWLSFFLIIYTYAGYPLILALLARMRSTPPPYPEYTPTVTILIAAYNEEKSLHAKLNNTLALNYPRDKLQILITDDGSIDRTAEIVKSFKGYGVELNHCPERSGKMAAINHAMPHVRGEILVLSDANNHYNPNAIKALVAPFQDETVGATGGTKYIIEGDGALGDSEGFYWKYEAWIKTQETRLGCATGATGEANALRRKLYVPPPPDTINDDFYIMMQVLRQGYRMIYVPEAISSERISASEKDEIERRTRITAGRYQSIARSRSMLPFNKPIWVWQVVSHKYMRLFLPFFMILVLISAFASVAIPSAARPALPHLAPPWNWVVFSTQIIFYLTAWIGKHVGEKGKIGKVLYMATFLTNSNFASLLGFWRFINKRQSTQWKRAQRRGENP